MSEPTVLIVEDDPAIGRGLATALSGQGYVVTWCETGSDALTAVAATDDVQFDLVLLDLGLPDMDGGEVCRRLRARGSSATIVMLTARSEEADVVSGLDAGADDYITKPFRLAELLARLRAHIRRESVVIAEDDCADTLVGVGDLRVDVSARRVLVGAQEIDLRPKEFDLLALLVGNAGRALTREHIMTEVWDEHWFGSTKTLDMHISALRRKLGVPAPVTITTLRGVGYRLEVT